jgi:hypothetical protein
MHNILCFSARVQREPDNLTETACQNRAGSYSGSRQTQHPYPSTRHRQCQSRSTHHRAVADGLRARQKHCVAAFQLDRSDDGVVLQAATLLVQRALAMCGVPQATRSRQPRVPSAPVLCVPTLPCSSLVVTTRSTARELAHSYLYAHGLLCVLSGCERNEVGCRRWIRRVRCRKV